MTSMRKTLDQQKADIAAKALADQQKIDRRHTRQTLVLTVRGDIERVKAALRADEYTLAIDATSAQLENLIKLREVHTEQLQRDFMKAGGLAVVPPPAAEPPKSDAKAARTT